MAILNARLLLGALVAVLFVVSADALSIQRRGTGPTKVWSLTWSDNPFGKFRPARNGNRTEGKDNGSIDDPTGLAPAESPGVGNALGSGADPQMLTVRLKNGTNLYVVPDVDFGVRAYLRASTDLNDLFRDQSKKHVIYEYPAREYPLGVGTEAADIVRWDDGRFLYTVSAVQDNTMRALLSKTDDPLGEYEDLGRITNDGKPLEGFDTHVIVHPNSKKYLTWSNHAFVQIIEMVSPNRTVGPPVNLVSYGVNTEAPTSWVYPNIQNGSRTLNLAYAEGIFTQANYNTRVLYIDVAQDPLEPSNWYQRGAPTLSSSSSRGVFGPGSGSFFEGPDGRTWFAYGAYNQADGAGDGSKPRFVRAQVAPADVNGVWVPTQVVRTPQLF